MSESIEWPPIWESREARKVAIAVASVEAIARDDFRCVICQGVNPRYLKDKWGIYRLVDPAHILTNSGETRTFAALTCCITSLCRQHHDELDTGGPKGRPQWLLDKMVDAKRGTYEVLQIFTQLEELNSYYQRSYPGGTLEFTTPPKRFSLDA